MKTRVYPANDSPAAIATAIWLNKNGADDENQSTVDGKRARKQGRPRTDRKPALRLVSNGEVRIRHIERGLVFVKSAKRLRLLMAIREIA